MGMAKWASFKSTLVSQSLPSVLLGNLENVEQDSCFHRVFQVSDHLLLEQPLESDWFVLRSSEEGWGRLLVWLQNKVYLVALYRVYDPLVLVWLLTNWTDGGRASLLEEGLSIPSYSPPCMQSGKREYFCNLLLNDLHILGNLSFGPLGTLAKLKLAIAFPRALASASPRSLIVNPPNLGRPCWKDDLPSYWVVGLIALTWSINFFDLRTNSSLNSERAASVWFSSSLISGSRACWSVLAPWFFDHGLSVHWHSLAVERLLLQLPWVIVSPLESVSNKDVRGAKASRTKVCILAYSLWEVSTGCGISCLMKLSNCGILVIATLGRGKAFLVCRHALFGGSLFVHTSLTNDSVDLDTAAKLEEMGFPHCLYPPG